MGSLGRVEGRSEMKKFSEDRRVVGCHHVVSQLRPVQLVLHQTVKTDGANLAHYYCGSWLGSRGAVPRSEPGRSPTVELVQAEGPANPVSVVTEKSGNIFIIILVQIFSLSQTADLWRAMKASWFSGVWRMV